MYIGNLDINICNSEHFNALINFQLFKIDYFQKKFIKTFSRILARPY